MEFKDSFDSFSKKVKAAAGKAADGVKSGVASLQNSVKGLSDKSSAGGQKKQSGTELAKRRTDSGTGSPAVRKSARKNTDKPIWLTILMTTGKYIARAVGTVVLIGVITGCIVGATAMVYVLAFLDKSIKDIDLTELKLNYTTKIYAYNSAGDMIEYESLHGSENREWVDEQEITEYTRRAAVAVEDERFWKHHGVDWKSTTFAFANMFLNLTESERGGSTITQQLIKNVTQDDAHSVNRKLTEIFKALELEKVYTKEQILEAYLNVIALGNGCNGIQTASQTYFGKDAKDLTLAESAAIVGITKYPSKYNPFYHPEENQKRQRYVLKKMYENGLITAEEYEAAKEEDYLSHLNTAAINQNTTTTYWSWYTEQLYTDIVNDLQKRNGLSESEARFKIYNGGYKIYANVDVDLQEKAETIFKNKSGNNTDYWTKFPRSVQPQCAIAILNYEGEIKAIVGARGEKNANRLQNHASQSRRQPGSAIKPLSAYGLAVDLKAIEFSTPVTDKQMTIKDEGKTRSWPRNSDNKYRGNIPVVKGLEVSANCVAARIVRYITPQKSYKFLTERLSIKLSEKDNNLAPMSVGALTDGVTVLEMASAYVIFGSGGIYYSPASYSLVTDQQGNTVLENTKLRGTRAISEESATIMNRLLLAPVNGSSGTARSAKISGFDTFGKTGTTSDNKDRYFCGGTPYYIGACWFGYADNKKLEYTTTNYATKAWTYVMKAAHKGLDSRKFELSSNVVARQYCTVSGGLASPYCSSTATGYYSRNTNMPVCPLHGGGTMTSSFTALLEDKSAFETMATTAPSTDTEEESTTAASSATEKTTEKTTTEKTTTTTKKETTQTTTTTAASEPEEAVG